MQKKMVLHAKRKKLVDDDGKKKKQIKLKTVVSEC